MSDGRLVFVGSGSGKPLTLRASDSASVTFSSHLDIYTTDLPDYTGPYVIVPSATDQTLPTDEHAMRDDVTVTAVPYFQASNEAGGLTVSILS